VRSHCSTQCGIQSTINVLARRSTSDYRSNSVWCRRRSGAPGGAFSACTISFDVVLSFSPKAVSSSTYSPGIEKVAVVSAEVASAKTTRPGPESWSSARAERLPASASQLCLKDRSCHQVRPRGLRRHRLSVERAARRPAVHLPLNDPVEFVPSE